MFDVDLGTLREDQVESLGEDEVLDLDDEFSLHSELVARLGALPHRAFFGCVASCLADLRTAYDEGLAGEGLELVERSLAAARAAANGHDGQAVKGDAAVLWADWCRYMKFDPHADDDAGEPVPTEVDNDLQGPCAVVVWSLADPGHRFEAAEAIARSAENSIDWDTAGANIRLLLRFIARANEARANAAPNAAPDAAPTH
jgi:hypothetical protein